MVVTNSTQGYIFVDNLDGEFLVCGPQGPKDFEELCFFSRFGLGTVALLEGMWVYLNAYRTWRLSKMLNKVSAAPTKYASKAKTQTTVSTSTTFSQTKKKRKQMQEGKNIVSSTGRFVILASMLSLAGIETMIYHTGTAFPTTDWRGQIGDFLCAICLALSWYLALLGLRAAERLETLTRLSGLSNNERRLCSVQKLQRGLDLAQGILALPISLVLWGLLASGVLKRSQYAFAFQLSLCLTGIRSMLENILKRFRAIVTIVDIQGKAGGDNEVQTRRHELVKSKARGLILDTLSIFVTTTMLPLSVLAAGSTYSSAQMAIHASVLMSTVIVSVLFINISKHNQLNSVYKTIREWNAIALYGTGTGMADALNNDGGQSIVYIRPGKARIDSGNNLFSSTAQVSDI